MNCVFDLVFSAAGVERPGTGRERPSGEAACVNFGDRQASGAGSARSGEKETFASNFGDDV